ncbi:MULTISPECIES: hypothetical protein [Enterobacterales]|uniref:hypothetical protein n=1 Tax=Enterobacterales TaxID=91347 RepID=UPI002ED848E8
MGALLGHFLNKTNDKQRVNRGYDSESGTTYSENPAYGWVFAFVFPDSSSKWFDDSPQNGSPLRGQRDKRVVQTPAALVRVRAPMLFSDF